MSCYLLFYSNSYCEYSKKFIRYLEQTGQASYFMRISVNKDEYGNRSPLLKKYNIERIPTIVVDNVVYTGIDAFTWLSNRCNEESNKKQVSGVPRQNDNMATRNNRMDENVNNYVEKEEKNTNYTAYNEYHANTLNANITDNCLMIKSNVLTDQDLTENFSDDDYLQKTNFILPNETITGIENLKGEDANELPQPINYKRDELKKKQHNTLLQRMKNEREKQTPQPISRM